MDAKGETQICSSPTSATEPELESPEARPKYLIVIDGAIPGTMLQIADTGASLGRASDNTIQFIEPSISRKHARFSVDINGHVGLTDLGSTNGTFVNGHRLVPNSPVWIRNGDRVQFGASLVLKFVRLDPQDERFQRELFERMVRDPLTGLFNRRYLTEQITPLGMRSTGSGLGLAVMVLDIDHFKRINDTHGHDAGDLVLREIAYVLRESTRLDDLVARYGGEEFVIAIPVAVAELAYERAERIRRQLSERRIPFSGQELRVTASLGLAFRPAGKVRDPLPLITEADQALYHAKRNGRNQVYVHPAGFPEANGFYQAGNVPQADRFTPIP